MLICPIFGTHKRQKHYLLNTPKEAVYSYNLKKKIKLNLFNKEYKKNELKKLNASLLKNLTGIA